MRDFETSSKPLVVFGNGRYLEIPDKICSLGLKKVFIAYGSSMKKHRIAQPLLDKCQGFNLDVEVFEDIVAESPDYIVRDLSICIANAHPDAVIALGGGSTIDTTRTALVLAGDVANIDAYLLGESRISKKTAMESTLICVPTTAGTGAEMSGGGPILNSSEKSKGAVGVYPRLADYVYLDPTLTENLPARLTYTTAMDALAHSVEGMTGKTRSHRSDMLCGQAVEYIWRSLPKALTNPHDLDARGELLLAASLAIEAETLRHVGHAVCQPVGAKFGIPHGETCALVLPEVLRMLANTSGIESEIALIARKANTPHEHASGCLTAMSAWINQMNQTFGVSALEERGISWPDVASLSPDILSDSRLIPNAPFEVTNGHVDRILRSMFTL